MRNKNYKEEYFKQLISDDDTGKTYIIDNKNRSQRTDIFGRKIPKFHKNFSGFVNFSQRLKKNLVEEISYDIDNSFYHPQGVFMEGYFQFPRPKVSPFKNVIKDNSSLIKEIEKTKRFALECNKKLSKIQLNQGINYFTSIISKRSPKNKKYLESLINDAIYLNKIQKKKLVQTDLSNEEIKGLKRFKKKMLCNDDNVIYGRELKKPNKIFITNFKINKKLIHKNPLLQNKINGKSCSVDNIFIKHKNRNKEYNLNNSKIKKAETLILNCDLEKKNLKGFQREKEKVKGIFQTHSSPKLPTIGELFKKDIELIEKVNPFQVELEKEKMEKDKIFFMKKRYKDSLIDKLRNQNKTINANIPNLIE